MRPIGGEIPSKQGDDLHTYLTDSGRSSLRLILWSGLKSKRFLLPDFLCSSILRVFDELNVRYAYYSIKDDLSIDSESVRKKEFDVLYVINYFGSRQKYRHLLGAKTWVVEDSAFLPVVERPPDVAKWIGFNSFRKISFLADGGLIKSTIRLADDLILRKAAPFSEIKYEAKWTKYESLRNRRHPESRYIALFEKGETALDRQKRIYSISGKSLSNLFDFHRHLDEEYRIRSRNYRSAHRSLRRFGIHLRPEFPCLYVLSVDRRDELKNYLCSKRIFLPVHWPEPGGVKNTLYDRIISVPVDARYDERDMARIAAHIHRFYGVA